MDKKALGIYIKKRRIQLDITQVDIAEKLNISTQAISKWENGISYPDFAIRCIFRGAAIRTWKA